MDLHREISLSIPQGTGNTVPNNEHSSITAIILCGGRANRFGGIEKPLVLLDGKPIVGHIIDALAGHVGQSIISANRELAHYQMFSDFVISDRVPHLGPLGGLNTALSRVSSPYFFCCPGDSPFLKGEVIERLFASLQNGKSNMVFAHDGERAQHLFMLGMSSIQKDLEDYLSTGQRSAKGFTYATNAEAVCMADLAPAFVNVNSAAELAEIVRSRV